MLYICSQIVYRALSISNINSCIILHVLVFVTIPYTYIQYVRVYNFVQLIVFNFLEQIFLRFYHFFLKLVSIVIFKILEYI